MEGREADNSVPCSLAGREPRQAQRPGHCSCCLSPFLQPSQSLALLSSPWLVRRKQEATLLWGMGMVSQVGACLVEGFLLRPLEPTARLKEIECVEFPSALI